MTNSGNVSVILLVAFLIYVLGSGTLAKVKKAADTNEDVGVALKPFLAWGVLYVIFIAATDIETTNELATAFAWLLLVAVFLNFGYDVFTNLAKAIGENAT